MRTSLLATTIAVGLATALATPALGAALGGDPATSSPPARVGAPAPAAPEAPAAEPPAASVIFNDPTGDRAAQNRIADHIRRAIDATPHHGTIRMAALSVPYV